MKLVLAALCDFAQVRDGLLSVISAGLTRLWRPQFPAPIGAMLALIIEVAPGEATVPREIRLRVENADGGRLAESSAAFQLGAPPAQIDSGELMVVPFAVDFREVQLPAAGRYQIVVDLMTEGLEPTVLAFRADFPSASGRG